MRTINSDPLELVRLRGVMALTAGRPDVVIGLVDGPVALDHPELAAATMRVIAGRPATCRHRESASCAHGTFIAGILAARRGASAPAIAPDCTLVVRPVFSQAPTATPAEVGAAIVDCVNAGAHVINLSAALTARRLDAHQELDLALDYAARRGVLVIVATGNQGALAGSAITRHPWVIPVIAYDDSRRPLPQSNLSRTIGIRGLGGPGHGVLSLSPDGGLAISSGTSIATPFVAGAAALLRSLFPDADAGAVKSALLTARRDRTIIPPLLDAEASYQFLSAGRTRKAMS